MFASVSLRSALASLFALVTCVFAVHVVTVSAQGPGPSVNLHQCANGGEGGNPTCADGPAIGWINSQINDNNGRYFEGDFYPNRQVFSNLTAGNIYCFAVGFDYSQSSLPAVDYLGSYNASIPADPTINTPFTLGVDVPDTIPVPAEPALSNGGTIGGNVFQGTQTSGELTLWGGAFVPGSLVYSNPGTGDLDVTFQQSIEYCFVASGSDAVLAFGAHIAVPGEWDHSERPTGAPYHISNGSRNGQFTPPRTSETDLAETLPDGTVVSNSNIGRTEQQINSSAIEDGMPTDVAYTSFGGDSVGLRLLAAVLVVLVIAVTGGIFYVAREA